MPPSTLQARIRAFEALGTGASKEVLDRIAIHTEPEHLLDRPHSPSAASIPPIVPAAYSPCASPTSLRHRSSLVDLKDWVIDDGPLRPSPTTVSSPLKTVKHPPHESAPLISFDGSPPKSVNAPPLPPRKLSFNSPRSVSAPVMSSIPPTASPSSNNMLMPPETDQPHPPTLTDIFPSDVTRRAQGHMQASSLSSFHSVSLSSDGDDSAPAGALHALPVEREWTGMTWTEDGESLDESFENVSVPSSFLPPITLPPRPQKPPGKPALASPPATPLTAQQPPKLPQRPTLQPRNSASSYASQGSSPSPLTSALGSPALTRTPSANSSPPSLASTRRAVPPPPPPLQPPAAPIPSNASSSPLPPPQRSRPPSARTSVQSTTTTASDRSSLLSQGTTTSRTSTSTSSRASVSTPAPQGAKQQALAARARYDALFVANVRAHAPKPSPPPPPPVLPRRQNAGWRGLSIDFDPSASASASASAPEPAPDARLNGRIVHAIWLKSKLEPQRLRDIWNECDPDGTGSLDRDAFARGMARIDEELRRAQLLGAGWSAGAALRPAPSRPILR